MARETIHAKARRYLSEGRVLIRYVDKTTVIAHVRGSDTYYKVRGDEYGWTCTCPSQTRCSHEIAVTLVTVRPRKST